MHSSLRSRAAGATGSGACEDGGRQGLRVARRRVAGPRAVTKGLGNGLAYADALTLLERGADPHRAAPSGKTFAQMQVEHRDHFAGEKKAPPRQFQVLWEWADAHGILPQSQ